MSNPPGWVKRTKLIAQHQELVIMAGLSAGVVAAADVNSQPAQVGSMSIQSPAFWANVWVILAFLYLVGIYWGHIRIKPV